MEVNDNLNLLSDMFKDKEWFHSVGLDNYGRFVVYARWLSPEIELSVPTKVSNHQVMLHFASSKTASREVFVDDKRKNNLVSDVKTVVEPLKVEEIISPDLDILTGELDQLEKICGTHILQDIFYEIHDGSNAVTNLSAKFPEVRATLIKLYDEYGFDIIYEEMDG